MKYILACIIITYTLASCNSTRYIAMDIRKPAVVSFPPEVVNVLVVDNTPVEAKKAPAKYTIDTERTASVLPVDSAKKAFLRSLCGFMNNEKYFSKVELYPYNTNKQRDVILLSPERVKSLCSENNSDAIISLDLFNIYAQIEKENAGMYIYSNSVLGAKLGTLLRVYTKDGKRYKAPITSMDSLFYHEYIQWMGNRSNLPEINQLLSEISVTGADKITSKIIPFWESQNRWYYTDNSAPMKEATAYVNQKKWKEALDIWGAQFEIEKSNKKKAKLASNIALANEYFDDIANAHVWIERAFEIILQERSNSDLSRQISRYRRILVQRLNNQPKLYKQLGIEPVEEN